MPQKTGGTKTKKGKNQVAVRWGAVFICTVFLLVIAGPLLTLGEKRAFPQQYVPEVERWSAEYGVDPLLVYALIKTESGFNPRAVSSARAIGLMQMTQDTFDWIKTKIAPQEPLVFNDLYNPETSIRFGVYFLAISLERYGGDVPTAAAAYHSGWGTVDSLLQTPEYSDDGKTLARFPRDSMGHYVYKINWSYRKYRFIYSVPRL